MKKLVTAGGPARTLDGGGNTHEFVMDETHAEPKGYLAATQTPDGVVQLISSALHYRFNLAWLKTPAGPMGAQISRSLTCEPAVSLSPVLRTDAGQ